MRYMVLVKATPESESGAMPSEEIFEAMNTYNQELAKAGVLVAGEGLHPSTEGARVRFDGKDRTVLDGPFAETKELIAGFWIFDVKSKEEAVEWVRRAPMQEGELEIRRVFEAEDFGDALPEHIKEWEAQERARQEARQS
ncbi:YciI family protein [Knoellia sp. p5-6-4]|uniref:YciI family protein n=1 Tax=unclassified Knoellia TaxID=2618719 RepID=UPI0023D9D94A|nr:YciI family protein [Knoellia sp. p5-6-4]MDF2145495.1 YciI family protein [Knoellia sp. p5-6-4]